MRAIRLFRRFTLSSWCTRVWILTWFLRQGQWDNVPYNDEDSPYDKNFQHFPVPNLPFRSHVGVVWLCEIIYSIYLIALKTDLERCNFQETFIDRFTVIVHSPASVVYKFRNAHHSNPARSCWFILTFIKIFWAEKFEKKKLLFQLLLYVA